MKNTKNQKLRNSPYLGKKGKLQNFGLSQTRKPTRFFFRKEKKDYIVFDGLNSNIFFVNKTAKEILSLLNFNLLKEEVIKNISEKYKISLKRASEGVDKILEEIR